MSATNPDSEYEALLHLARRVALRFPSVDEDSILETIVDEFESFDRSRLRAYVPQLVEHNVIDRIRLSLDRAA
jgi:hypothetical protein